jgi:hypothetical protein
MDRAFGVDQWRWRTVGTTPRSVVLARSSQRVVSEISGPVR